MPHGRMLIVAGVILVAVGLVASYGGRLPIHLGRLPGDIRIEGKNSAFYFPLTTCLLLSAIISLVLWILRR